MPTGGLVLQSLPGCATKGEILLNFICGANDYARGLSPPGYTPVSIDAHFPLHLENLFYDLKVFVEHITITHFY